MRNYERILQLQQRLADVKRLCQEDCFFLLGMEEEDLLEAFWIPEHLTHDRGLVVNWILADIYGEEIRYLETQIAQELEKGF